MRLKDPLHQPRAPLIVKVLDIGNRDTFSTWTVNVSVLPPGTKVAVTGYGRSLLRNLIVTEGDKSKDIVATYSDSVRERIEQVLVIVLAALIGVGASAVFGAFIGKVQG